MFSVITNIYNKKTKGPTLMELFTATGKLKNIFLTTGNVQCVPSCHQSHVAMVGRTSTSHHCHVTSQARIIAAVKNIDAPMLMRVW
jgi:hypothetical protein